MFARVRAARQYRALKRTIALTARRRLRFSLILIALLAWGCALDDPNYGIPALRQRPDSQTRVLRAPDEEVETHNWSAAINDESERIATEPADAADYMRRGDLYSIMGQYDLALSDFNKAISMDPSLKWTYFYRAETYAAQKKYAASVAQLDFIISKFPNDWTMLVGCSRMYSMSVAPQMRDSAKAIAYASKACELTSWHDAIPLETLAAAYASAGNFDRAVSVEKAALAQKQTPQMTARSNSMRGETPCG